MERVGARDNGFSATFGHLHLSGIPHEWTGDFLLNECDTEYPHARASQTPSRAEDTRQLERQASRVLRAISISVVCGQHLLINVGSNSMHDKDPASHEGERKHAVGDRSDQGLPPPASQLIHQIVSSHANVSNGIVQLNFSAKTTCNDLLNTARMGQIFIAMNVQLACPRVLRAFAEIIALRMMPLRAEPLDSTAEAPMRASSNVDTMPSQYMCIAVCTGAPLPYEIRELFMMSAQIDHLSVLKHAPVKIQSGIQSRASNGYKLNQADRLISELGRLSKLVHVSNRMKLFLDDVMSAIEAHPVIRRGPSRKRLSTSQTNRSNNTGSITHLSSNAYLHALRTMAAICANEYLLPRHVHALLPDLLTHRVELEIEGHETRDLNAEEYAQMARAVVEDVVRTVPL